MSQLTNLAFFRARPGRTENWRSAEGSEAHMRAPHVQAFLKAAPDLIADDIDLRRFSMITTPAAPRA